jgi:hypothetical protein
MAVEGERELEDFLTDVFEGKESAEEQPPEETPPEPEQSVEAPEVVHDRPRGEASPPEVAAPPEEGEPLPTEEETEEAEETGSIAWAKKKYGDDPEKWANAAYQMEQHISRLAAEKQQAEEFARQMAEYAQYAESQALDQQQAGMPLSSQEEEWIEQALGNPVQNAYGALIQGNYQLYNGLIERIATDNPALAANVGAQAQMAVQQTQAQQQVQASQQQAYQSDFPSRLNESVQRVGVNLQEYGEQMSEKIGELGEYHPYVQTIMHSPDPEKRDLALMAVLDLVRTGRSSTQRARESEREAQIRREGELRREAASVVTGSPHVEQKKESPFMEAMMDEWKRRGQWPEEET